MNLRTLSETLGFQCTWQQRDSAHLVEATDHAASPLPVGTPIRLESPRGPLIVKISARATDQFLVEANGLATLSKVPSVRTPHVYGATTLCIAMERFDTSAWSNEAYRKLGSALAEMHMQHGPWFGFEQDGWIGRNRQHNTPTDAWGDFFIEQRLQPQLAQLRSQLSASTREKTNRFCDNWRTRLNELQPAPSLLHGDLWGGNALCTEYGPVFIDPAVYYGHAETDIAMTRLFGGFAPTFYDAYYEIAPAEPGFDERMDVYNLYHLLNHANLFGGSYLSEAIRVIDRYT